MRTLENFNSTYLISGDNMADGVHLVVPLVEIFSVTVHGNFNQDSQLYGLITVIEDGGKTFDIFDQPRDEPQPVLSGTTLWLVGSCDVFPAVFSSKDVTLVLKLYCKEPNRDVVVADDALTLESTAEEVWLEDYHDKRVKGENSGLYAVVHYAIYPYAVTAAIDILFFSKDYDFTSLGDESDDEVDVFGETRDRYDLSDYKKNYDNKSRAKLYGFVSAYCVVDDNGEEISERSSVLYDIAIEDSYDVDSGSEIDLFRAVVAVPAYSSLKIKATFFNADDGLTIACDVFEFRARQDGTFVNDILGDGGLIRARVNWSPVYEELPSRKKLDSIMGRLSLGPSSGGLEENCVLPQDGRIVPVVELFSILVCGKDGKPFKFYGDVVVNDDTDIDRILLISESSPRYSKKSGTLVVFNGPWFSYNMLSGSSIRVWFHDVSRDMTIIGLANFKSLPNIYRRVCSVVPGAKGFCALYCAIIPDGVSARVTVKLCGRSIPSTVKGEIYARHGYCEPLESHQEKLFKSILFYGGDDGVTIGSSDSTLPLVKNLVSLPRFSYLTVEADLSFVPEAAQGTECIKGSVEFKSNDDPPKQIGEGDIYIEVCVKFFSAL